MYGRESFMMAAASAALPMEEVTQRIHSALERIRPALQMDGGDITFLAFDDGVLRVSMSGACSGCSSIASTMTMGVERVVKSLVPEVRHVEVA